MRRRGGRGRRLRRGKVPVVGHVVRILTVFLVAVFGCKWFGVVLLYHTFFLNF